MTQIAPQYSLWLRPTQIQIDEFTNIISELAHRYRTILFPPHITLLSSITVKLNSVEQACEKIIDRIHSFEIPMQKIAYTTAFYRNLFIMAELTSTLTTLHEDMKTELEIEICEEFMPHVSLLYGKLDVKIKEYLKNELSESYPKIFQCSRLDIYNSTGKAPDWFLVNSYELHQSKK